jgi:hypothetical protein
MAIRKKIKTNKRKTMKIRKTSQKRNTRKKRNVARGRKKTQVVEEPPVTITRTRRQTLLEEPADLETALKTIKQQNKAQKERELAEARAEEISEDIFKQLHESLPKERKSKRVECTILFTPKDLVPGKAGYNAVMNAVPLEKIQEFVETKIDEGPQLVTLPVSNQSHIILVDVQSGKKIMISDWRGRKFIDGKEPGYVNYQQLVTELESKYNAPVQFYFIDPVLLETAEEKSNSLKKRGGCSEYAYAWSELYYKKGHYEWPFRSSPPDPEHYPLLHLLYNKSERYKGL